MTFNSELRDENPEEPDAAKKAREKAKGEKQLDEALKDTFPGSDPLATESPVTGSRARKPEPPEKE